MGKKDDLYRNYLMAIKDEQTVEWIRQKDMETQRLMTYYQCALMEVETKFRVLDAEYSLRFDRNPINSIKTRLKKFPSIMEKLGKKGLDANIESIEQNIYDVAGIRVICPFVEDVYTLADTLVGQDDITLIKRKDYIKCPKENGYRSLHLIVAIPIFLGNEKKSMNVEIQLRTIAMDCWASLEHQLRYKKDLVPVESREQELLCCAQLSAELDKRMDKLRAELDI